MSGGPYKQCSYCDGPGVTCNHCPLVEPELNEHEAMLREEESIPDEPMLVELADKDGNLVGHWVMGKAL